MNHLFTHPAFLYPALAPVLAALALGIWAQTRPGLGVRVVGQHPLRLGLALALIFGGLGLGLAQPRFGTPEVPRLTVHVVLDASRSMLAVDEHGASRWAAATAILDRLWAKPNPNVRFSLDLATGDSIPVLPPGEDRNLLRDALKALRPGEVGSPGTSLGRGLPQTVAQVEPRAPAVLLLLSDGDETWESQPDALARATAALRRAKVPLYALCLGQPQPCPVPVATDGAEAPARNAQEPPASAAQPDFLRRLAEGSGGRLLESKDDLAALFQRLSRGQEALPAARSITPAHPEWGAWIALAGLALWFTAAGQPLRKWRTLVVLPLLLGTSSLRAGMPLPQSVRAWLAQAALDRGDLAAAQKWRPAGHEPDHRLLAALIDLRGGHSSDALATLAPLTGLGCPHPAPPWRTPALLLAARASLELNRVEDARNLLERLLQEQPGQREATYDLQTILKDAVPPPPNPKKPPPPPPPRPSQGARQDEIEGLQQRVPKKPQSLGGVKDL